jgi:hypothetical protein
MQYLLLRSNKGESLNDTSFAGKLHWIFEITSNGLEFWAVTRRLCDAKTEFRRLRRNGLRVIMLHD